MDGAGAWLNEPPEWNMAGDTLTLRTGPHTDFWARTMGDQMSAQDWADRALEPPLYVVDNGHFYYEVVEGDFTVTARASGDFNAQFDQVGLFLRQDADNWLKASVEVIYGTWSPMYTYSNPANIFGCTLTRDGYSAWSPLPESENNPSTVWVRMSRSGDTFFADYSETGEGFSVVNMFSMPDAGDSLMVGIYATSPTGQGFDARVDNYSLVRGST